MIDSMLTAVHFAPVEDPLQLQKFVILKNPALLTF